MLLALPGTDPKSLPCRPLSASALSSLCLVPGDRSEWSPSSEEVALHSPRCCRGWWWLSPLGRCHGGPAWAPPRLLSSRLGPRSAVCRASSVGELCWGVQTWQPCRTTNRLALPPQTSSNGVI